MLELLTFHFAQLAILATIFISLTCGLLSPVVVLKQRSYLGDTLSHLVFPGVIIGILCAQYSGFPLWACVAIGSISTALLGTIISEWFLKKLQCPPDAAAIVCLTTFFALGIVLISHHKGLRISPDSIFFGDVLTLNKIDLYVIFGSFIAVLISIIAFKKHWNAWLVDCEFAQIAGFNVSLMNKLFPILLTISVLSGLFAVGGLMISALITIPSLLYAPKSVFSFAVVLISLSLGLLGLILAFIFNWPVGPSIVLVGFVSLFAKTFFKK